MFAISSTRTAGRNTPCSKLGHQFSRAAHVDAVLCKMKRMGSSNNQSGSGMWPQYRVPEIVLGFTIKTPQSALHISGYLCASLSAASLPSL
eukprot:CAMPEP_0171095638 /NCGR_PEP_ID=MMETSP0766_2-20121228/43285_1 /TAXON_ID=439317 /ORGANISM="Gambierdiscus australes, Strain CAWD 149" /LENGTH=90 /DNA_ID=CAMNT_0011554469 /DNA_START=162 /DNA_END=434 /DNA_ORIENTATION=-